MSETLKDPLDDLSLEDVKTLVAAISEGVSPAEVAGLSKEELEALYSLGHWLYSTGEFRDAETAFRSLCLYDYHDSRYWMGLGATLQAQDKLSMAAEVYGMAGMVSKLEDPAPFYYAGLCLMRLGDFDGADASLRTVEILGQPGQEKNEGFKTKAINLRAVIKEKMGPPKESQEGGK
jgi:type III secretion system low calcium response chaperone LcrH/SycD